MSDATFINVVGKQAIEDINKLKNDIILTAEETAKLNKMLKNVSLPSQLKSANAASDANLKKINSAVKESDRLTKKLVRSKQRLADAQSKEGRELEKIRQKTNEVNRVNRTAAKIQLGLIGNYKRLLQARIKAKRKLDDLLASRKSSNREIRKAQNHYDRLSKKVESITAKTQRYNASLRNQKTVFGTVRAAAIQLSGALGLLGGAYLAVSALRDGIRTIRDFGATMANVAGIYRESREDLKSLEEEIISVAGASINTATQVAKTAESLATLGKSKEQVKELLKPVNDLSIGLKATSDETGEFLIQTLNAFGAGTEEAAKYADQIATIRTSTSLDFQRMRDAFQYISPISNLLNKDLAYTGAVVGILSDNSLKAESAGRLLSTAQIKLATKGKTLADALGEINEAYAEGKDELEILSLANDLFGKQAAKVGVILAKNSEEIEKNAQAIRDNSGALDDLVNEQLTSLDAKFKILSSRIEEYILNTDKATGFSVSLGKAVEYVSNNLARIVNALYTAIKVFVLYKAAVLAVSVAKGVAVAATTAYRIAVIALNGGLLRVIRTIRAMNIAMSSSGIGLFLAVLGGAYAYFTSFADGADEATKANDDFNDSLERTQQRVTEVEKLLSRFTDARQRQQRATELLFQSEDHLREKLEKTGVSIDNINEAVKILNNSYGKTSEEIEKMIIRAGFFTEQQKRIIRNNVRDTNILIDQIIKAQEQIDREDSIKKTEEANKRAAKSTRKRTEALKAYTDEITPTAKAIQKLIDEYENLIESTSRGTREYKSAEEALQRLKEAYKTLEEPVTEGLQAFENHVEAMKKGEEQVEKYEEAIKSFLSTFSEDFISNSGFQTTFDILNKNIAGFGENFTATFNAISESAQEVFNFITQLSEAKLNKQLEDLQTSREIELSFAENNETAQEEIRERYRAREEELQAKAAQRQKDYAVFNSIIDTAQASLAAYSSQLVAGDVTSLIRAKIAAATTAAFGLAKTALILSTNIPQFKDGHLEGTYEGLAITNDGVKNGKVVQEVLERKGKYYPIQGKNTLIDMKKGDKILPSMDYLKNAVGSDIMSHKAFLPTLEPQRGSFNIIHNGLTQSQLESTMTKVMNRTLAKQPKHVTNLDKTGISTYVEGEYNRVNYTNNVVRF